MSYGPIRESLREGRSSAEVTPSDTEELAPMRALYVGTGGNIVGQLRNDTEDRTFKNVPDGTVLPFDFKLITTDTDAEDLIAIR